MSFSQFIQFALYGLFVVASVVDLHAEFDGDMRSWQTLSATYFEDDAWRLNLTGQTRLGWATFCL